MSDAAVDGGNGIENEGEQSHATRFRFKQSSQPKDGIESEDVKDERKHRRHVRRRYYRGTHKRRKLSEEHSIHTLPIPPEDAFRESLFDALADDEGADFWQGVYGQPIHNYSRTFADAETGSLETMTDDQYAQYVRRRMWEKSAEGIESAREKKRQERKDREEHRKTEHSAQPETKEKADSPYNNFSTFDFELEASLRRGQRRKDKKKWQQIWQDYLDRWKTLQALRETLRSSTDNAEQVFLRNKLAWPVESGRRKDVVAEEVQRFVEKVTDATSNSASQYCHAKTAMVKSERIKWHPDKIQQLYGFMNIDRSTMESVTAVFQILDRLWNELRSG